MQPDTWDFGLFEISYPKGYKKSFLHNTIRLDLKEIIFPVKQYKSVCSAHKYSLILGTI